MPTSIFCFDGWKLDAGRRRLLNPAGEEVHLTSFEMDTLIIFCQNPQQMLSRAKLTPHVGGRALSLDRTVDVRIARIRNKLEADPAKPIIIKTIRQNGYWFAPEVTNE